MRAPLLAALLLLTPQVFAADVEIDLVDVPRVAFEGRKLRVEIELINPSEDVRTVTLSGDPSLSIRGPFGGGRSVRVINGARTVSYPIQWELTASKAGTFPLGSITVVLSSGTTARRTLGDLRVLKPAPQGTSKLLVRALEGGPVGFPFRVAYTLLTAEERHEARGTFGDARFPFGLEGLEVAVFGSGLPWEPYKLDPAREASELRIGEERTLLVQEAISEWEGHGYYATTFGLEVTPKAPGPIDLSAKATLQVVGGTKRVRDFFGRVQDVPAGLQRSLQSDPVSYLVAKLPPGAPPGFTGAVGRYSIRAECAVREANAFDPIEVTITIEGEGLLEDVKLPAWQTFPEISESFQVATDVDPGKVSEGKKVFTKTFRAKTDRIAALPPLPFPHFDPQSKAYVVARSAPVPLTIRAVKTVTAADAVGNPTQGGSPDASAPTAIVARDGIGANAITLGDERPQLAPPTRFGPLLWTGILAPPLAWALVLLLPWLRARATSGPSALSEALATLEPESLDAVRAGLSGYLARRLELGGEITAPELEQALRARVVAPDLVERVLAFWKALEASRFSGGGDVPPGVADLLRDLERVL